MAVVKELLIATVSHHRFSPKKHSLKYKLYYLCFPFDSLKTIKRTFLSLNKFNLLSFYEKDYGFSSQPLDEWLLDIYQEYKFPWENGSIVLLTLPRVLGFVFNPLSFWFFLDQQGNLRAVLTEVNNTFGERHCYLSFQEDYRPIEKNDWIKSEKVFHVSPFLEVKGYYLFRFDYRDDTVGVWIDYYDGDEKIISTSLVGNRVLLTNRNLIACFFRYPFITFKVVLMIHYNAFILFLKRIPFFHQPKPPLDKTSR